MNDYIFKGKDIIFKADNIRICSSTIWFYLNGHEVYRYFGKTEEETQEKFEKIKQIIALKKFMIEL